MFFPLWCWATIGYAAQAPTTQSSFVVVGTVRDADGKPMEAVEVRANCGMGTLKLTGKASSGPDGKYNLTFGPGVLMGESGGWGVGTQFATISPHRDGVFEKNLGRQGNLMMTDETSPHPWGNPAGIVHVNQPYQLDFVMLPAATVDGQLVSESGPPLANQLLYLTGKELPPSCSVLEDVQSDSDGRFRLTCVPTDKVFRFLTPTSAPSQRTDLASSEIRFDKPTTYGIKLTEVKAADGRLILQITPLSVATTQP
jgi:hypothetical protein